MTTAARPGRPEVVRVADEAASVAATESGVSVREVTSAAQRHDVQALLAQIWRTGDHLVPVPSDVMRALSYSGSYVAAAYDAGGIVGATVSLLADDADQPGRLQLHSHVTGVTERARRRHVGLALKLHQRAWALRRGCSVITWTFDPLVRRNACFNLTRLGAHAAAYLVDFYGEMVDGINAGHGSDRLLVRWDIASPDVADRAAGQVSEPDAIGKILVGADGGLVSGAAVTRSRRPLRCAVPIDIEAMRRDAPERALHWRAALRAALPDALENGYRITGCTRDGWYILHNGQAGP